MSRGSLRVRAFVISATLLWAGAGFGESARVAEERQDKDPQGKLASRFYPLALQAERGQAPDAWAVRQAGRHYDAQRRRVVAIVELSDAAAAEAVARVVRAAGGRVTGVAGTLLRAELPPAALRQVARDADVLSVRPPMRPHADEVVSQGVATIAADAFRDRSGFDGRGVRVGLLDGAFGGLARALGRELPADTVLTDSAKSADSDDSDHGTACAEILHDVAPGATLVLARAGDEVTWSMALDQLLAEGVKVISSSIGFPNSYPSNGRSFWSQRVAEVVGRGVLWVSSAGNYSESFHQGTARDADSDGKLELGGLEMIPLGLPRAASVVLRWDEGFGFAREDYDLFVVTEDFRNNPLAEKSNPAVVAASTNTQVPDGSSWPLEWVEIDSAEPRLLYAVVVNREPTAPAATRKFSLWTNGRVLGGLATPQGSISLPADAPAALAAAAVDANTRELRGFSSRGPTDAGLVKPDVAGPDGVATSTYEAFFGTSAAAPHVAGAAALLLSRTPSLSVAQLREQLERATPTGGQTAAKNNEMGFGLVDLSRVP